MRHSLYNGFRRIFGSFWRESVKLLQFYNKTLPATLIVDERKLLSFGKMFLSTNVILRAVSCIVRNCFLSVGSKYGITACTISKCGIKDAVWQSFSSTTF